MDDFNTAQRPRMMVPIQGRDPGFAPKGQESIEAPGLPRESGTFRYALKVARESKRPLIDGF
jgi:hypothetical protein